MTELSDIARATCERYDLVPPGAAVVVMVSGGADSVALLHLFATGQLGQGLRLSAIHINHMLRGAESDADESFVRDLCARLGVELEVARVDVAALAASAGQNLEDAGREVRYRLAAEELDSRCASAGIPMESGCIATGHTRDDRVETYLMRVITGAGSGGLSSLRPRRGRIIRPLAECSRELVRTHLSSLAQPWREDASNLDTTRLRARIRHEVVPMMRQINPRFDEAVLRSVEVLSAENDLLAEVAREHAREIAGKNGAALPLDRAGLARLSQPMRRRVIREVLKAHFPQASRVEFDHVEALAEACGDDRGGYFARDLPGGLRVETRYGTITVLHTGEDLQTLAPSLLPIPGTADLGIAGRLRASRAAHGDLSGSACSVVIDGGAVSESLSVTCVRPGDRMRPLGMSGTRKLSDMLIDEKLPARLRPRIPVVRDGDRIVWLAGVRMSEEYKVVPETRDPVRLTWEPGDESPVAYKDRREG